MKKYLEYAGIVIVALVIGFFVYPRTVSPTFGSATGYDSLKLTPSASTGDTYGIQINGVTTEDMNGNIVAPLLQTNPAALNVLTGQLVAGNITNCGTTGYSQITASTTLTPAQFLATCNELIIGTTGPTTITLPVATTTYLAAGSPTFGGYQVQLITNDSTSSVTFTAGVGMAFKCETQGIGTTTVIGGCTSSSLTLNATSTAFADGYWDNSSSSFVILWGNEFH